MARSLRVSSNYIEKVKLALKLARFPSQQALCLNIGRSKSTVQNFFNGKPVDYQYFVEISETLGLNWQEIAATDGSVPRGAGDTDKSTTSKSFELPENREPVRNWFGRDEIVKDLKDKLLEPETRAISITAVNIVGLAGIGKSTLATKLLEKLKEENALFVVAAWESLRPSNGKPPKFNDIIDSLLDKLSFGKITKAVAAEYDPHTKINRLVNLLKKEPCLLVLDNVETVLQTGQVNKAGYFSDDEECQKYASLFQALAGQEHHSKVIFTSREKLADLEDKLPPGKFIEKQLPGLETYAAVELLRSLEIGISTEEELEELAKRYERHPKALKLVGAWIRDYVPDGVETFLRDKDYSLPPELGRIIDEVIDRLSDSERTCLSRISVYQTQRYPLSVEGIIVQMMPEVSSRDVKMQIIPALIRRQLLDYDQERKSYQLHPLVQERAFSRLDLDKETKSIANRQAASFYLLEVSKKGNIKKVEAGFQAIHHFSEIGDFDSCYQTLIFKILEAEDQLENLRCSENLWSDMIRIIEVGEKIIENLPDRQKAITLIPLGVLYPEVGENKKAIKAKERILEITDKLPGNDKEIIFAKISANLIGARANKFIGNFSQALKNGENASKIAQNAQDSRRDYWKALALYELGTVHIEIARTKSNPDSFREAFKALNCIVISAFKAVGIQIPEKLYEYRSTMLKVLFEPIENLWPKIEEVLQENEYKSRDDYTKKFRIIYNVGRCLNTMKWYPLAKLCLDKAFDIVSPMEDKLNIAWSYVELANCYSGMGNEEKAEEYYEKAISESSEHSQKACRAFILLSYADWNYRQNRYERAFKHYEDLERLVGETDFSYIKARVFYGLSLTYPKLGRYDLAFEKCDEALKISEQLGIQLAQECMNLQRRLRENRI